MSDQSLGAVVGVQRTRLAVSPTQAAFQRSSEYQYLRIPVISAFGNPGTGEYSVISAFRTPGTREYSVISAFGTPGTREYSVISAFGTPGTREYSVISAFGTAVTEPFKMTDTRESLRTNDWHWYDL